MTERPLPTDASSTHAPSPSALRRFGPLAAVALFAALAIASGAYKYVSLESLKEHYAALQDFVSHHYAAAVIIFIIVYICVTAASLPGATVMSLAGGFLFGIVTGLIAVVIGAALGATIIFQIARTAFGDALRKRASGFIKKLEDGFNDDAFSYLLLLRLIPIFPFFIVNIAPAIFGVKTRTFFLATLIGIIPGAFAYVSAGNGLGAVLKTGGEVNFKGLLMQPEIFTPIIALSVLAIIPIIYHRLLRKRKSSRDA